MGMMSESAVSPRGNAHAGTNSDLAVSLGDAGVSNSLGDSGTLSVSVADAPRTARAGLRDDRRNGVPRPRIRGCAHAGWDDCVPGCLPARRDSRGADASALSHLVAS